MDGTIITKRGVQLLAKLMATKGNLGFTRVTVGTGAIPSGYDPASMIDLAQYKMDGKISKCEADGDVAKITMQISSVGIETGFTMTEMGVFAEDPDIGEILYAYLDMKEDPQYIYAEGGEAQKFMEVTLEVAIGTATKVTAIINPESMITREQFDEEMATKVTTAGGDIADTTVSAYTAVTEEYPEPKAGDTMTTIIGKVVKFIQDAKEGFCRKSELVDNCTSSDTDKPPTAKQAKVLWDKITAAVTALTTHKSSGDHDGRYYTESEINNLLAAKVSKSDLVNNATSAATDKAPTANQVKVLNDRINALNGEKLAVGKIYFKEHNFNVQVGGRAEAKGTIAFRNVFGDPSKFRTLYWGIQQNYTGGTFYQAVDMDVHYNVSGSTFDYVLYNNNASTYTVPCKLLILVLEL